MELVEEFEGAGVAANVVPSILNGASKDALSFNERRYHNGSN